MGRRWRLAVEMSCGSPGHGLERFIWAVDSAGGGGGFKEIGGHTTFPPGKRTLGLLPSPHFLPPLVLGGEAWDGCGDLTRPPAWPRPRYMEVTVARGVRHHP